MRTVTLVLFLALMGSGDDDSSGADGEPESVGCCTEYQECPERPV